MNNFIGTIVALSILVIVFVAGKEIGKDGVRHDVYSTCVANNPEIPNGKIKEFCDAHTKAVLSTEIR